MSRVDSPGKIARYTCAMPFMVVKCARAASWLGQGAEEDMTITERTPGIQTKLFRLEAEYSAGTSVKRTPAEGIRPTLLDFFAGSGLVTEALKGLFDAAWANDIDDKKAAIYRANHPTVLFRLCSVERILGHSLPQAVLSWASFPCQDMSLAGKMQGIGAQRSGLVWEWLRVMDEMTIRPPLVVAENVGGLVEAEGGAHYRRLHRALTARGYRVGALEIDAYSWLPQSRRRIFVVGTPEGTPLDGLESFGPGWGHSAAVCRAAAGLDKWVWWSIPQPDVERRELDELVDTNASCETPGWSEHNLSLIAPKHRLRMEREAASGMTVFPGYRRVRQGKQVLELRFDGCAGCLRTPSGGSSRQIVVLKRNHGFEARRLTVVEAARLMGVRETYVFPGSDTDGYRALGDAVAIPAVRHLGEHLLLPLTHRVMVEGGNRQ